MDNLESTIADIEDETQFRSRRMRLDNDLEQCETLWLMLRGKSPDSHRHRCPPCGAYSVCPQAYGEDCPLEATAPADCQDDPYGGK